MAEMSTRSSVRCSVCDTDSCRWLLRHAHEVRISCTSFCPHASSINHHCRQPVARGHTAFSHEAGGFCDTSAVKGGHPKCHAHARLLPRPGPHLLATSASYSACTIRCALRRPTPSRISAIWRQAYSRAGGGSQEFSRIGWFFACHTTLRQYVMHAWMFFLCTPCMHVSLTRLTSCMQ